jgi:hypothetical protein
VYKIFELEYLTVLLSIAIAFEKSRY